MVAAEQTTDSDWYLQIPEGVIYGPVITAQLDQWVRDGRVGLGCQLRREDWNHWQPAELRYPELQSKEMKSSELGVPSAATDAPTAHLSAPLSASAAGLNRHTGVLTERQTHPTDDRRTQLPHRAAYILTLALVGVFVPCPVFSVLAWQQGTQDLYDMHTGLMDATGRSQTQFGRKLGMVVVLFWSMMFLTAAVVGAVYWAIR